MPNSDERPLLTFALFAYNQERFIADAVRGALSQTYTPLEIILSDDCSSDRTFEIMQELAAGYQGPNRVIVRRNEQNLGLIGHINRVMELVQGELIVAAAGDDISLPERVERTYHAYLESERSAYSIFSNAIWIDENGCKMNLLRRQPVNSRALTFLHYGTRSTPGFLNGCTHAWKRECFDFFGPLMDGVGAEDTVIPFRSALLGNIVYIHDVLVLYRQNRSRMQNHHGKYLYSIYRNNWVKHQRMLLNIFRNRLQDLEVYLTIHSKTDEISIVLKFIHEQISELSRVVEIFEMPLLRQRLFEVIKRCTLSNFRNVINQLTCAVIPLQIWYGYLKLIAYYIYQEFQKGNSL
ncbi:MAG: glycosyltransferase [Chloroflexota bacterium]